ncbi:hypothetical protein Q7P37_005660 [Cladosporium fusiforme]
MAPRVASSRAGASDSEDDLASAAAISSVENKRAAQNTLTATKFGKSMRRNSTTKAPIKRKAPAAKQSRQALKDRTNHPEGSEDEDENREEMEAEEPKPKAKRARTTAASKKKTQAASEPVEDAPKPAAAKRTRTTKRAPSAEPARVIPETQQDPEHMEDVSHSVEGADEEEVEPAPVARQTNGTSSRQRSASVQPLQPRASARSMSAQPGYPAPRDRSGSVSGTERRGGDPELRRKLNEMTRKHENLSLKYQNLQELGKNNAETNFEKLKRASDDKAKTANELIASLKKELAEARKATKTDTSEATALQKQVNSLTSSNEKLVADNKELKAKAQAAQSDSKAAQNEIKSMEAKLVAARAEITAQEAKAKGAAAARNIPTNTSESQKEAKMKENLYSDLTGLIIRNVKRKDGEDEFDCLQTGRNGSKYTPTIDADDCILTYTSALHFHLTVANDTTSSAPKTPSGQSYEEAEFTYEPLLDESRDGELIDILPDYLTEDIEFPRHQALKFYHKMLESMMKRIMVEEE